VTGNSMAPGRNRPFRGGGGVEQWKNKDLSSKASRGKSRARTAPRNEGRDACPGLFLRLVPKCSSPANSSQTKHRNKGPPSIKPERGTSYGFVPDWPWETTALGQDRPSPAENYIRNRFCHGRPTNWIWYGVWSRVPRCIAPGPPLAGALGPGPDQATQWIRPSAHA
jgi:hypothetical protein